MRTILQKKDWKDVMRKQIKKVQFNSDDRIHDKFENKYLDEGLEIIKEHKFIKIKTWMSSF